MIRFIALTAALLALTACGAPGPEYADCELPAIGDPCSMPATKADAIEIIVAAAYCPGEIEFVADVGFEIAVCTSAPLGVFSVGEVGPGRFAHQLEDGSTVRCDAGRVTSIYRAMAGTIDGKPALFSVPDDDCDTACRADLILPACR